MSNDEKGKKLSILHTYPTDDVFQHEIVCSYIDGTIFCSCLCSPDIEGFENGILVKHNSFDGREFLQEQRVTLEDILALEERSKGRGKHHG